MQLAAPSFIAGDRSGSMRWLVLARGGRGSFFGWMEKLRRLWERRFDRLGDYLRKLQEKERHDGRKK